MGIQGLHKGLSFATQKTSLRDFRGKTLAVDASCWLHRSVYSVSEKYVEGIERGIIDKHCVQVSAKYVISRCRELLQAFQIGQIYLVMDGKRCPLKADTNGERERRRQANLKEAREYKDRHENHKAEEKYKTCIKIKDELTEEVMAEVRRNFQNDERVHLTWSPYEADAQLAKLCVDGLADAVITEDSDVLVYSAAAHCAFPVIFKLDRQTGKCDVISMDWLLSSKDNQVPCTAGKKPPSALESLLINLASRQSRRPGFGVRLFVQGCVLAGCDYAPNKLTGVGLVNAFKYVRDNSYRNDSVRFSKVLDAIPRKNRPNIDTREYELNLAKSEAVFYYHIVQYHDGSNKPLCEPRTSEPGKDAPSCHTQHSPLMERFGDDWSFLGKIAEASDQADHAPKIKETACLGRGGSQGKAVKEQQESRKPPVVFVPKKVAPARNPYAKPVPTATRKRSRDDSRAPLDIIHPNAGNTSKFFAKFARTADRESSSDQIGIRNFYDTKEVRYVKRDFSSVEDRSFRLSCSSGRFERPPTEAPRGRRFASDLGKQQNPPIDSNTTEQMVNAGHLRSADVSFIDSLSDPSSDGYPAAGLATDTISNLEAPSFFDLTDSNSEPFIGNFDGVDDDELGSSKPARVSLDDSELIDSPDDSGYSRPTSNLLGVRAIGIKSTRLDNSFRSLPPKSIRRPQSGPLIDAFRKQKEKSPSCLSSQSQPWVRSFRPVGDRKLSPKRGTAKNTLDSYFSITKQNSTRFKQLGVRYDTKQTDESFLWDGPE